ncbi:uncharacterized protein LOC127741054 [Arachis duranensis]|uniref:Uncharacterized protein LOC127741054 n=1 Tax=Arachis duranensis TaxID=130453 RepID=A0A9C6T749_ARADU|nr:uncharacterized protein LOC127741054 [Arachis duranensis]
MGMGLSPGAAGAGGLPMMGGTPWPVAAIMEGSAWRRSHSIVSPSLLLLSSRVSWKTKAAHAMDRRTRRSRPSTLMWRSFLRLLDMAVLIALLLAAAMGAISMGLWFWADKGEEEYGTLLSFSFFIEVIVFSPLFCVSLKVLLMDAD